MWTLINPLVMVLAYWFVFTYVFPTDANDPFALFLFVGLATWGVFMGGAQAAASSLVLNANLVTKVKFPRQVVPLSAMTGSWFTAGAMFCISLPLCLIFGHGSKLTWLAIPPVLGLLAGMTVGVGLLLAAVNVYFRDTEHILAALGLPWFFLTPILYDLDQVPADASWAANVLHYANPVTPFVLAVRDPLFFGTWPSAADCLYCAAASVAALAVGWSVFKRLEGEMAVEL